MSRAYGSGTISLGLVSLDVQLFKVAPTGGIRDKLYSTCDESCGEKPKQNISCAKCGKTYSSWWAVPGRAFDAGGGTIVRLTTKELNDAKSSTKHDALSVEKVVSVGPLASTYVLSDPSYLLPKEDSPKAVLKVYRALVTALGETGKALLGRLTIRNTTRRLAVLADMTKNVLTAYVVEDAQPVPRDIPVENPDALLVGQAKALLAGAATDDVSFPTEADPVEALISAKLDAIVKEGLKTTA